jgi:hypothetical protein
MPKIAKVKIKRLSVLGNNRIPVSRDRHQLQTNIIGSYASTPGGTHDAVSAHDVPTHSASYKVALMM